VQAFIPPLAALVVRRLGGLAELIQLIGSWTGSVAGIHGLEAWRATFRPYIPTIERVNDGERSITIVRSTQWAVSLLTPAGSSRSLITIT